jgi:predicted DNA-binding transcriptional regulator AlpA
MLIDVEELITFEEVSRITKMKINTLRRWASQDKIPCRKLNGAIRFSPGEIREWLSGAAAGKTDG